ncbi:hypothetical protein Lal_00001920 [Lupinus albus]|nr:hypothetical protein Lal_00001891 [Lupinus albus]KAF1856898.1 hypothetical protein Lal_00001920 [Lupinus albus]
MKAAELKIRLELRKRARPRIGGLSGTGEGPGFESNRPSLSSQGEASCSHSSNKRRSGLPSRGRAEPHLAVGRFSLLGRVQKGGGMKDSDLTGDSSLARAF